LISPREKTQTFPPLFIAHSKDSIRNLDPSIISGSFVPTHEIVEKGFNLAFELHQARFQENWRAYWTLISNAQTTGEAVLSLVWSKRHAGDSLGAAPHAVFLSLANGYNQASGVVDDFIRPSLHS
jgi:hypothetical protein